MLSCQLPHQIKGTSIPNYPDTCMCDRGRSTDIDEGWHVVCRNVEVLAEASAWTQKCPVHHDSEEMGWKRDTWLQCYQLRGARMTGVPSCKCSSPKTTISLRRCVQSDFFFRWVSLLFFFQMLVMQEERLLLENSHQLYFCKSFSYPKDCSIAARSRAMSVQAAGKRP